jgi:hypothetical protein
MPYSRLIRSIEGILIRVVHFLAYLDSMQVIWEGYYCWYRIESKHGRDFDNGRIKAKSVN